MRPFLSPLTPRWRHTDSLPSVLTPFGPSDSPLPKLRRSLVEVMATGTPDSQARFGQSVKGLLTEKVNTCGTDVIALTKQVLKGSRSSELLGQAARNMVLQEDAILHSEDSLRKMAIITTHLQYQQEAIQKNVEQSSDLQDQLNHLLK
ncbi:BLOC-1-related complex subunit 7 isoform X1 [Enhydra lutris kenyoni]|uniref:BLOC-1-related complex subunit 7 n=1 Tax=Enhydra lutris kenyoni TaxID=391180 RepID=A0A2Y9J3D9_ENHLU|nr:BLOC-1-related complex subunit 7 isoform X1 [Enhydra lutris kenyoni]